MKNLSNCLPIKKLRLLNNAISPASAIRTKPEDVLNSMDLDKNYKIVLSLGRLTEQKGYDLLIESFKHVVKEEPETVLLIGGDGPDRKKLERQIIEAGMQKHIRLLGIVDDVDELFIISDIYVNSSRWEGLPVTLLEAMSRKKPVLATNVGGNGQVIKDGETGLLVPSGHPNMLAEGILKILRDNLWAAQLAERGYELFRKEYSIEKHCGTLVSEYLR